MTINGRVSPFRNLRIEACLPAPRSLSQATTSFIASRCQGIHHTLLIASSTRPPTGIKQSPAFRQVHALERLPTTRRGPAPHTRGDVLYKGVTGKHLKRLHSVLLTIQQHQKTYPIVKEQCRPPKRLTFPADAGRTAWVRHAARLEAGSGSILVLF